MDDINIGDEVKVSFVGQKYSARGRVCDISQDMYPGEWHALVTVYTSTKNSYQRWLPIGQLTPVYNADYYA